MLLTEFLDAVYLPAKIKLKPNTLYQFRRTISAYERHLKRPPTSRDFALGQIRRFLAAYATDHKAATVNAKRSQLLAMWRVARKELSGAQRPEEKPSAKRIPKLPDDTAPPEAWTFEEFQQILAAVRSRFTRPIAGIPWRKWWESILLVAYDTGERRGALLAVRPYDLDFVGGWVRFYRRKGRPRICSLAPDTVAACREVWDSSRSLMWPWPYTDEALSKQFRRIVELAGLPRSKSLFHQIRRTTGSIVEQHGGDGAKAIGDTRRVFERHYLDPRFLPNSLPKLPRP